MKVNLDPVGRPGAVPVLEWVGGPRPYIWIGDDDGEVYATCEPEKMVKMARLVLDSMKERT